ncbi:hypothetical protein J4413_04460 [Candidatus Woesearchaeota archaeon]|nr:hypothetical protein [Candidatus Woesearchaeota archaeon]
MDNQITHFSHLFENITEVVKTKPYEKETRNNQKVEETEKEILNKDKINSENLHKFEKKIENAFLFRSGLGQEGNKKSKVIVYCVHDNRLIFLRFVHHKEWEKFLDNNKNLKILEKEILSYE